MTSNFSEHTNANYFLHTGSGLQGRPSMGAWVTYGLGSESKDLPGFVVVNGGLTPPGGLDNFNSGFLPASYQASVFKPGGNAPVANISRRERDVTVQRGKLDLLAKLDAVSAERSGGQDAIESAIANYEMAFRMQSSVPELTDLSDEPEKLKELYGMNHKYDKTRIFASECLMARRLVERGVRFVELTCPNTGNDRWDAHSNLKKNHENNSLAVDQPIGALLTDLKQRGMLKDTLVIWAGEFGRTPLHRVVMVVIITLLPIQSGWLVEGLKVELFTVKPTSLDTMVEGKLQMHDMHATMLHLWESIMSVAPIALAAGICV